MIPLLRLMRLYYSLPLAGGFIVILAYLVGNQLSDIFIESVLSFLSLFFIISAGYVFNDACDIETDRINCPRRMLPAGRLKRETAVAWSALLLTGGLVSAACCGWMFFIGIMVVTALLVVYNMLSKRMGFFKDLLIAVLATSLYPLAFMLTEPVATPRLNVLYILPVWLFFTALGYEMLKDIRDIKGDSSMNHSNMNHRKEVWFLSGARFYLIFAACMSMLPFFLGYCEWIYFGSSILAVILTVAAAFSKPLFAIRYIYAEVFIITAGSMADLLVYGP